MIHIEEIRTLVQTLLNSSTFHALIIQSPPGWGKSSSIEQILTELSQSYFVVGTYSTPLSFYNTLAARTSELIVIDDCSGLFGDSVAMSVLKAATWPSTGSNGQRVISWSTSSEKPSVPQFTYLGKLILLTNSLPSGRETEAFLSRALVLKLDFSQDRIKEMLLNAAASVTHFPNADIALGVAVWLCEQVNKRNNGKINLRTLSLGYELALANPGGWQTLLERLLPDESPESILNSLTHSSLTVEEQAREFYRRTGLSRRSFFNHRRIAFPS